MGRVRTLLGSVVLAASSLLVAPGVAAEPASAATRCQATMSGTFLPPFWAAPWGKDRYRRELVDMGAVGIKTVILQQTVDLDTNIAYFPTPRASSYTRGPDVAGSLIKEAGQQQAKVVLGLANSNGWAVHAEDVAWLSNRLQADKLLANRLHALYRGRFTGWYIPYEVDDYLLATPAAVAATTWFLNALVDHLRSLDPNLPIMTSPFYQATWQTPVQFAQGVRQMFSAFDIVNLQDGAGQHRSADDVRILFSAVAAELAGTRPQLWDDPDMYLMGVGPMPPAQLQADLQATCGAATGWTGFAFSTQMSPLGVGTPVYFDSYRAYVASLRM